MNGEPGGHSLKMPVALIDIIAAHHLKEGLLLAMLDKAGTGRGKLVEVSLMQTAVASLANQATNFLIAGKVPQKQGSAHPNIAPYGDVFMSADGKEVLLAVGTDQQFVQLTKILNISDIANDFRFKTNVKRVENRPVLYSLIANEISRLPSSELMEALAKASVPAGIIRNVAEVLTQPEVADLELSSGYFRGIKTFVANAGETGGSHFLPPPGLGEHTAAILKRVLNLGPSAIQTLFSQGVIG
jgi:crotonobetainyl-CoA:carnitine CoA-transferase CaiB-like acyl-CoA transferase